MAGRLEDGKLRTLMGDVPLNDGLRRTLETRADTREVLLGIRPEAFEDAALVPPENREHGVTFRATIDVVESMGSEVYAYFAFDGQEKVTSAELAELARDSGQADTGGDAGQVVARLDAATTVREGAEAELWADVRAVHVFDPGTGENLTADREPAPA
jgi:multiple sugar transport system ATP-binding protein